MTVREKMNKVTGGEGNGAQKFTSTHPSNNDRIKDLNKNMVEAKQIYAAAKKK